MLFSSPQFIFYFVPAVLVGYALLGRDGHGLAALLWLIVASLFFYAYWNPPYLLLLLASIAFNLIIARKLHTGRSRSLLVAGIAFNLGVLGYFKYAGFFVNSLNWAAGSRLPAPDVVLPLAISFFTFQKIAFLVDVYQGNIKEPKILNYLIFVTFFPQLIAGPIVHYNEIVPQFEGRRDWSLKWSELAAGAAIFVIGLQKKIVIADALVPHVAAVFTDAGGSPPSLVEAWIGTLAFTFQLYFDFSGYSDMAIGLAWMFGIRLPENFNSPYKAANIIEFWRRWHMTLSRFLRDYLYVPLGGNRYGFSRRCINILVTMLLGGLWHGAAWTFVFWGALHGIFLVVNHGWRVLRRAIGDDLEHSTIGGRLLSRAITLMAVIVAWVFFRAESWSDAGAVLAGLCGLNGIVMPTDTEAITLAWLAGCGFIVLCFPNTREILEQASIQAPVVRAIVRPSLASAVVVMGLVVVLIVLVKGDATNNFIYMIF